MSDRVQTGSAPRGEELMADRYVAPNYILAGRYKLEARIGVGGMAYVYRAYDLNTGHEVAVKLLRPELARDADYVSRFQREAEAASKVIHTNIVNLLDVGLDGDKRYLVMELVTGKTLKQVITEKGRISPETAAQITIRILSALHHAHSNGIIHRDIKPQNILVNADGMIKVADFGIARIADRQTITREDIVMGSVHYFSPEQASGHDVDARSDIYSVGVTMYEMLTGQVPFDGESQVAIAMMHLHDQPKPIRSIAPEVPPAIAQVCAIAMAKDPNQRYQSAREMAEQLRYAMNGRPDLMSAPSVPMPIPLTQPQSAEAPAERRQPTGGGAAVKPHSGRQGSRRKINVVWWLVTLALAGVVFYGLWAGSAAIYDRVVNSTEVPDLVGLDITAAERSATKAGLVTRVVENNHPTVSVGTVILQAPEMGTTLKKGDAVVLTVSKGPASQMTPSVVGLTFQDAITVAQNYGLTLTVVERVVSGAVQADFIISQVPEANTQCKAGDIIQVTVSGGLAEVPATVGTPLAQAQDTLAAAGLTVSPSVAFINTQDRSLHGRVAAQSLEAGTQVIRGTSVSLTCYQVPGMMHSADVTLDLPESQQLISVRVTLTDISGEVTVYQSEYPADATRHPVVRLTAQNAGRYTYRVYINDEYKYQKEIVIE